MPEPTTASTPEQQERYRRHECIDGCGRPYSAGRPRCDTCDAERIRKESGQ